MDYSKFPDAKEIKTGGVYYVKMDYDFEDGSGYEFIGLGVEDESSKNDTLIILNFIKKSPFFHKDKKIGDTYKNNYFIDWYTVKYLGDKSDFPEYFI
jgi:hypothetical protein